MATKRSSDRKVEERTAVRRSRPPVVKEAGAAAASIARTTFAAPSSTAAAAAPFVLNCVPSRGRERDWTTTHLSAATAVAEESPPEEALPEEVDHRRPWWKINHQGDTGSCVGWALADSVLRWHFAEANKLGPDDLLSARFLWMASKETDEFTTRPETFIEVAGTSLKAALDITRDYGCVRNELLPFDSGGMYRGDETFFFMSAAMYRIAMYVSLSGVYEWKSWLAKRGPFAIRLEVDRKWRNATATGGVLDFYNPYLPGDPNGGGHAVAVVGYRKDGTFIIRNSWGTGWGDQGYAYASSLYADKAVTEAYGVVLSELA
ncbi:MAG: C1 family peptidase [Planctomycetota bacterium]|nr:C1 family peptidase [Planctomycetota bacterium]